MNASGRATSQRHASRGQSLVEFAILAPVFLLLLGAGLDVGRLFYASIAMENAAKEGALAGATNPRCDTDKDGCVSPNTVAWHVDQDLTGVTGVHRTAACVHDGSEVPVETCTAGDSYRVRVSHRFRLVTPVLVPLFGTEMDLEAEAVAPVVNDAFDPAETAVPVPTLTPTPAPTPTPTAAPSASSGPVASAPPSSTPTPTATSIHSCRVPDFTGVRRNDAVDRWSSAGFTGPLSSVDTSGNYRIGSQSLEAGALASCASSITVGP